MRILLVEDDEYKRRKILSFLQESIPEVIVREARSVQSGLRGIMAGENDVVILDMTMPTFDIGPEEDGGRPQAYAGRELLRNMKRKGITTPTLVVTQFDRFGQGADVLTLAELDAQLRSEHSGYYLGAIYYNVMEEGWKGELLAVLNELRRASAE